MIRSMTGYGRVQQFIDGFNILLEIKSVNHRFYEFSARVPRLYGYVEEKLKAYMQGYISRGKVDVFLTIESIEGVNVDVQLNYHLAESYIAALRELRNKFNLIDDISVANIAHNNDIFTVTKPPENENLIWNAVKKAADSAIAEFVNMRTLEGERLKNDIAQRAEKILGFVDIIEQRSPSTVEEYRARLTQHMKEVLLDIKLDENRILMEAALYADKTSVTEETVRLKSHFKQFSLMLEAEEPVGRKLDFLMQEMNREANTIGSKALDLDIASVVVEIKAELEKIREQIQNIE
jgi:uncharacterized protein (TIGR00255 family)